MFLKGLSNTWGYFWDMEILAHSRLIISTSMQSRSCRERLTCPHSVISIPVHLQLVSSSPLLLHTAAGGGIFTQARWLPDWTNYPLQSVSNLIFTADNQTCPHYFAFLFARSCLFCSNCKCLYSCKKNSAGKKYCYCTLCLVCNVMMFREWSPCLNVSTAQTSLSVSLFRLSVQTHTGICVWVLINVPFFSVGLQWLGPYLAVSILCLVVLASSN